jgi:tRNA pseudouridine38-40 synthase
LRYFLEIAYNGKNYNGWQIQPNAPSIQETLTNALSTILRKELHIVGAGRTDAGVHASQLFVHFDVDQELDEELVQKLNSFLPDDIVVKNLFSVDDEAHARFDAISRSYEYRILLGRDPFMLDTTWQLYYQQLDVEMMNNAAAELLNHTNFKSFSKSKTDVKTYNCKVTQAKWILDNNLLTFHISADRFLRNMVRAIVGTLIEVGLGKKTVEDFREIIESEDRSKAGFSVPPQGLFLVKVAYPEKILKNYK